MTRQYHNNMMHHAGQITLLDVPSIYVENKDVDIWQSPAIPIQELQRALSHPIMNDYPHEKAMLLMKSLTGCRITELDNMMIADRDGNSRFKGAYFSFNTGKNQHGVRTVYLGWEYIKFLKWYREKCGLKFQYYKLFGHSSTTFKRVFDRDIRPALGGKWMQKLPKASKITGWEENNVYPMRGTRHTFESFLFWKAYKKWNDYHLAGQEVCQRMGYSTAHMALDHYIKDGKSIGVEKYIHLETWQLFSVDIQTQL